MLSQVKTLTGNPEELESKAFAKAIQLLQVRSRSTQEMQERLAMVGYPQQIVQSVCQRLTDCLLLDDVSFAEAYIRSKKAIGWGRVRIERELVNKGVDINELQYYPESYFDDDAELGRALEVLANYRSRSKNIRDSQFRHLISKGFPVSIASNAIRAHNP